MEQTVKLRSAEIKSLRDLFHRKQLMQMGIDVFYNIPNQVLCVARGSGWTADADIQSEFPIKAGKGSQAASVFGFYDQSW